MTVWQSARIAIRALQVNKLRSALTMLGIIIGVAAVITMVGIGAAAQARIAEQIKSLGSNLMIVLPGTVTTGGVRLGRGSKPSITEDDAEAIQREVPSVQVAAPSVRGKGDDGQVVYGNVNWTTLLQGVTLEFLVAREWEVVAGNAFSSDDLEGAAKVALLGQTAVQSLFGDVDPIGQVIRIKHVPFTVIGVLDRKGQSTLGQDQDDIILIPLSTAQRGMVASKKVKRGSVHEIHIKVRKASAMKEAEEQVRALLRQRHRLKPQEPDDFWVRNLSDILAAQEESSRVMTMFLAAVASVSLLVGGIGIMNIMLVSVTERTREIGLRMAVGARSRDILGQFLVEAVTLSLIGGLIGMGLGVAGAYGITYFAEWRTLIQPEAIFVAFSFAAAVGIFFGFYPARKASRLDPIEALRYE